MNKFEEKLKTLLGERETILTELADIKRAYDIRQERLIEIAGSIKTLQELIEDNDVQDNKITDVNNTTEK